MHIIALLITLFIIAIHIYIMVFEMFLWESRGPKIFRSLPASLFPQTKVLAANQGLYNGFLAAGLIWGLTISDDHWQQQVTLCFLLFVLVAGLYGAYTAEKRILLVQSVPAAAAILALLFL